MTNESNDPEDRSEQEEAPDQVSSEEPPADTGRTEPADDTGSVDTETSEDTAPPDDSEESTGGAEANGDATGADTDVVDTEESGSEPDGEGTTTPDSSPDSSNETPETDPDPPGGPTGDRPTDDDNGPERTRLGYITAIAVPIVGVAAAIILFAIDVNPRDALLIGFAYLSLVTVGTGLYVFTNDSERKVRLLRATGGLAAALLGVSVVVVLTADTDVVEIAPIVSQPVPLFVYVYAVAGALGYVFTVVGEQRLNASSGSGSESTSGEPETEESGEEQGSSTNDSAEDDTTGNSTGTDPGKTEGPIEASKIYDWSIRVLAAIPLAAAVFLLASLLLPQSQFGEPEVVVRTADGVVSVNETGVSGRLTENSSVQNIEIERRRESDRLLAGLALLTGLFVNTAYTRLHDLAIRLLSPSRKGENGGSG